MTTGTPTPHPSEQAGRRQEVERLFQQAQTLVPEKRAGFLDEVCRDDPSLREELRSLLEHAEGAEVFFERLTDRVFSSSDAIVEAVLETDGVGRDAHPTPDLPAGHVVGHYRILGRIGAGGMGTVYRARDTRLDREVALKFLPAHLSASQDAEERLLVEARAVAALEHPNVCTVYEIGESDDGRPFIAMALYGGETLQDRLQRGPLTPEEAVAIAIQVARGLDAAHTRGIVHRDVKPGNVMLTADGSVKLLDFGLAKLADATLTRPGATPGTVAYMSPEQARGDPLAGRTDLWSLGVVLYEMLAGMRPFRGGNDRALIQAILHQEPEPVQKLAPDTPESLQPILDRLLRKDPEARYRGAGDVVLDLERALSSAARRSRAPAIPRRSLSLAGAAVALALLTGAALWFNGRDEESVPGGHPQSAAKPSIAVLPFANLSTDPGDVALADGMTQELIAILARNEELKVIASTSVFAFRNSSADVRTIADSLRVANVLEGAFQKIGSRLRVQVRLVDATDGSTLWSETYDSEFQDVFSIQEDIARAVAGELDVRLTGDSDTRLARGYTRNVAAYEFYLRGSDQALLRSDSGVRQGVEYFQKAVAADSMYAAAWAGLARLYARLTPTADPGMSVEQLIVLAEQAASRAVALDDSLAEGHASVGLLRWHLRNDLRAGESELKRAIALDPNQALFHQWLAQLYLRMGRSTEALVEARRALEIDPLAPSAHAEVAHALIANGRYDEALARLESIAQVQPPLLRVPFYAAQAYAGKGMWAEALAALPSQKVPWVVAADPLYGHLLARSGQREEALQIREALLDQVEAGTRGAFDMVVIETGLGNLDQAFAWLERSIDDGSIDDAELMQPIFNELRQDPRFERFRPRLGIQNR